MYDKLVNIADALSYHTQPHTACPAACIGTRTCLSSLPSDCCNFYDTNGGCVTGCPSGEVPNSPFQCSGMYKIYIISRLLLSRAENKGSHGSCSHNCDLSQKSVVMIRTEWICRVSSRKNKLSLWEKYFKNYGVQSATQKFGECCLLHKFNLWTLTPFLYNIFGILPHVYTQSWNYIPVCTILSMMYNDIVNLFGGEACPHCGWNPDLVIICTSHQIVHTPSKVKETPISDVWVL